MGSKSASGRRRLLAIALGHGSWPWLLVMALGHGSWPWHLARAEHSSLLGSLSCSWAHALRPTNVAEMNLPCFNLDMKIHPWKFSQLLSRFWDRFGNRFGVHSGVHLGVLGGSWGVLGGSRGRLGVSWGSGGPSSPQDGS